MTEKHQGFRSSFCNCAAAILSIPDLDTVCLIAAIHGCKYQGEPFRFCPFCGKALEDQEVENEKDLLPLPLPSAVHTCGKCGAPSQGPHRCPWEADLYGNEDPEYCTCCDDCEQRCAADI